MTAITIWFSTPEEEERNRRFQVRKNYLGAIDLFIAREYGEDPVERLRTLVERQAELRGFRRIQGTGTPRTAQLRRFLMLSWASEAQLRVHDGAEGAVLPYANAWAPVHAYYAVYMGAVAWLTAQGHPDASDHGAVLRVISRQVSQRRLFPLPWSTYAAGSPDIGESEWHGIPEGVDPRVPVELLANPSLETFWPRYCKMLETTRKRLLKRRYEEWCRQNDRRITRQEEKRLIAQKVVATTIFDFLWRLRVRSNYQDVELFLLSTVGDDWHREFYRSICAVTEATCVLLENLILRRVGRGFYRHAIDEFRERGGPLAQAVIGRRAEVLLGG